MKYATGGLDRKPKDLEHVLADRELPVIAESKADRLASSQDDPKSDGGASM